MEPKNNKILLVFLFWCIILFNLAQAICVPRNRSEPELSPSHASSKLQPPSSPVSTPISHPPPSHPSPSTTPVPPQETPDSSPEPSSPKSKFPKIQISLPTGSLNVGVGVKTVSDPRIKSLCDKTDQPALCIASIAPFFNGKSDLPSVIEMLIKAGTEQTKQAIATAAKMATDSKSDPKTVSRLNDCKEIYDDALDNLQEATDAIPLKDVGTIATMVSAAISDYGTCDDGFTGQPNPIPEGVSPMAKINENLMNIAEFNSLAIMETFGGSELAVVGCAVKKKRSSISRRPRITQQTFTHNYILMSSPTTAIGSSGNEDQNFKNGSNGFGSENKLKLKLKLGGVTRTIHTKSTADHAVGGVPSLTKSSHFLDAPQTREKSFFLNNKGSYLSDKGKGYGDQWKDFSRSGSGYGKGHSSRGKAPGVSVAVNEIDRNEPTRKSKRVPKRRVLDVGINSDDDDDEDEEIRYLGRVNASNGLSNFKDEEDEKNGIDSAIFEDRDYVEKDESISDDEPGSKRKKLGRGSVDLFVEGRTESTPTTRNRALQSGKDHFSGPGASFVEFPDGLPPAPSKKQKEKLSEVEQQLKKAEAAQRRRMQSEKAAREAEAEAIRKILGQDSGRKKREEKMKKQRDELAQGKASKSETLASNTVRWVIGPAGTTVIFSEDIGLPQLFNSAPCSYPPPREKCAGPNCTNTYKYRDSKSKLPLCSLDCYKAIHAKAQPLIAC